MNDASKFTREELVQYSNPNTTFYGPTIRDLAAFALALLDRAEKAERELAEAEEAIRLIERITVTYEDARGDGESERVAKVGQAFLDHPAVRRALERGKG